jgi:hypothetical protein
MNPLRIGVSVLTYAIHAAAKAYVTSGRGELYDLTCSSKIRVGHWPANGRELSVVHGGRTAYWPRAVTPMSPKELLRIATRHFFDLAP